MASQRTQPRLVPKLAGQDMPHWRITVLGYLHNIEMGSGEPVVRNALIDSQELLLVGRAQYWPPIGCCGDEVADNIGTSVQPGPR